MNFKDAETVATVVNQMAKFEERRANNRAKINRLFNGEPPYTEQERIENNLETNYNSLEGTNIIHQARSQWNNAYLKPAIYFTATTDMGPLHERMRYSNVFTKLLNRVMKKSLQYTEVVRAQGAQVLLHGVAPVHWSSQYGWRPETVGLGSLLLPSNTLIGFENLPHFAISKKYTQAELFKAAKEPGADSGWNQAAVNKILKGLKEDKSKADQQDHQMPERVYEEYRANSGYFGSDAAASVDCWDFYFIGDDKKWHRRIILKSSAHDVDQTTFLFDPGARAYADDVSQLIHVQYADGNNVAPFYVHSVRSLGWLLYAVCHVQNRLNCKFTDAVFESMMMLFRNAPGSEREFKQLWDQIHQGFLPSNIGYVPANERFQVNADLVMAKMSQNRQNMAENSASFTQDINDGTAKEMTATETMNRVNAASAMVGSMLNLSFTYQDHQYREIARRFCLKNSSDQDVVEFQKQCELEGLPVALLNPTYWEIKSERTVGNGNKTLQLAQARNLMEVRNLYDPTAQREILHLWTEANADDAGWADHLVPLEGKPLSDAAHDANLAMGTLMLGLPVALKQGMNHIDYIETLLQLMDIVIQRIEAQGGMTTEDKVAGLANCVQHVEQHIAILAQDPDEKERVKQYGDILGQMVNKIKGYAQRIEEQKAAMAQQGPMMTPEAQAKIVSSGIVAQKQMEMKEAANKQKMEHKELAFEAEQHRKDVKAVSDAQATIARTKTEIAAKDLTTQAEIIRQANEPKPETAVPEGQG